MELSDADGDTLEESGDARADETASSQADANAPQALLETLPPPRASGAISWTGLAAPEAPAAEPTVAPASVTEPTPASPTDESAAAAPVEVVEPIDPATPVPADTPVEPTPAVKNDEPTRVVWSSTPSTYGSSSRRDDY